MSFYCLSIVFNEISGKNLELWKGTYYTKYLMPGLLYLSGRQFYYD